MWEDRVTGWRYEQDADNYLWLLYFSDLDAINSPDRNWNGPGWYWCATAHNGNYECEWWQPIEASNLEEAKAVALMLWRMT